MLPNILSVQQPPTPMGKVKSGGQSDFSGDFCSKIGKFDTSTETKTYFVNFYEKIPQQ